MRLIPFTVVVAFATLSAASALADPPAVPEPSPRVLHLAPRTIYGRPNRPMVVIDIKTPTAAEAAGAAHESLRTSLLERAEPAALRRP